MSMPVDVTRELRAARPVADAALHARVRAIAARDPERRPSPFARFAPRRRSLLIALPAAAVLAAATVGAIGFARKDDGRREAASPPAADASAALQQSEMTAPFSKAAPMAGAVAPPSDRAQRYAATLTLEVTGTDELADATQRAQRIARDLGGFAANVSYASAESGASSMTLRIPTDRVQEAIAKLTELGTVVGQQVQVDDLQESLDELAARIRGLRERVARLEARLADPALDADTRAALTARRASARAELAELTRTRSATRREASLATIQLALQTDGSAAVPAAPSGIDRTLDQAVRVLAWQGVALLFLVLVAGPLVAVAIAAWLGARTVRRRGEARALASP
jgi:hypothetical protein